MNTEHRTSNSDRRTGIKTGAIIVAGGAGKRMEGTDKLFLSFGGKPLLALTLEAFQKHPGIDVIVLVVSAAVRERFEEEIRDRCELSKLAAVVEGGERRQDSVYNGLLAFPEAPDLVLIHDGDRPFIDQAVIAAVLTGAGEGGAIAAVPARDTLKWVDREECIVKTIDREVIWQAQTPQGFPFRLIQAAHEKARKEGWEVTDDASMMERLGERVRVVKGSYDNLKITTPEDIFLAEAIFREWEMGNRE
jgi:2-C-methyl-D-erythritol 4-phosphate cytidylyltransferase